MRPSRRLSARAHRHADRRLPARRSSRRRPGRHGRRLPRPRPSLWSAAVALKLLSPRLAEDPTSASASSSSRAWRPRSTTPTSSPSTTPARWRASCTWPCATSRAPTSSELLARRGRSSLSGDRHLLSRSPMPSTRPRTRARAPRRQALQRPARRARARLSRRLRPHAGLSDQAPGFEAGLSLGTPAYVAPEQIEGKEVDGRADQYSLACLLHECLTGEPPFPRGSEAAALFAHLEEAPPPSAGLEDVIPMAMASDLPIATRAAAPSSRMPTGLFWRPGEGAEDDGSPRPSSSLQPWLRRSASSSIETRIQRPTAHRNHADIDRRCTTRPSARRLRGDLGPRGSRRATGEDAGRAEQRVSDATFDESKPWVFFPAVSTLRGNHRDVEQ